MTATPATTKNTVAGVTRVRKSSCLRRSQSQHSAAAAMPNHKMPAGISWSMHAITEYHSTVPHSTANGAAPTGTLHFFAANTLSTHTAKNVTRHSRKAVKAFILSALVFLPRSAARRRALRHHAHRAHEIVLEQKHSTHGRSSPAYGKRQPFGAAPACAGSPTGV